MTASIPLGKERLQEKKIQKMVADETQVLEHLSSTIGLIINAARKR